MSTFESYSFSDDTTPLSCVDDQKLRLHDQIQMQRYSPKLFFADAGAYYCRGTVGGGPLGEVVARSHDFEEKIPSNIYGNCIFDSGLLNCDNDGSMTDDCRRGVKEEEKLLPVGASEGISSVTGGKKRGFAKRKAGKPQDACRNMKVPRTSSRSSRENDAVSKITSKNSDTDTSRISQVTQKNGSNSKDESREPSKEASIVTKIQKTDYIHVRARRGEATDSHSLAERARREKISERMKYLQNLVPGCNKITGKAGMLDEIINYVQSLQKQVEFLSMKLAAVNTPSDFDICSLYDKEIDALSAGLLKLSSASPVSIIDSSCLKALQQAATWDARNFYEVEFNQQMAACFPAQIFDGSFGNVNVKMEM